MKAIVMTVAAACVLAAGPAVLAEVHLNEIYASHAGTDDQEFIELIGTGSLDDFTVVVIEGDSSNAGTIDRVWALTDETMPGDGYFVMGDTAVDNLDYELGTDNTIENGTETFLLIENYAGWPTGTDIDAENDGVVDVGFENPGTIADIIGMVDSGFGDTDFVYYGTDTRGPDGSFFPAGIFRTYDYPNDWDFSWLDFDDELNLDLPRTPGTMNVPEPTALALLGLGLLLAGRRRR